MVGRSRQKNELFVVAVVSSLLLVAVAISVLSPAYAQDADVANCTVTPDQILGQAFSATAGAAGETAEDGLTPEGEDIVSAGLVAEPEWIISNLQYSASGEHTVAILVMDDFSSDGTEPGNVPSHGWLVYEVFEELHEQLPAEVAGRIVLEQVNIADENGYRSDTIVEALETALDRLTAEGIERFVLNMSFVIIPCQDDELGFDFADFRGRREQDPGYSLVRHLGNDPAYVRSLLQDPRVAYIEENGLTIEQPPGQGRRQTQPGGPPEFVQEQLLVLRLFENSRLQSDPLRDFLRRANYQIVPVASAGNFKWRRPFFPARWQEVISVSATEGNDLRRWLHSNSGEVSVPGAWYLFDDGVYRAGTSFAAPVLSILLAVDLTQETPVCGIRGNAPELTHGAYNDTPLLDAVAQRC